MSDRYSDFLEGLNDPQVRALSSQSGLNNWDTEETSKLREMLRDHKAALKIYQLND